MSLPSARLEALHNPRSAANWSSVAKALLDSGDASGSALAASYANSVNLSTATQLNKKLDVAEAKASMEKGEELISDLSLGNLIRKYTQVDGQQPGQFNELLEKARELLEEDLPSECIGICKYIESKLKDDSEMKAWCYYFHGAARIKLGEFKTALSLLSESIKLTEISYAALELADYYASHEQYEKAFHYYSLSIKWEPIISGDDRVALDSKVEQASKDWHTTRLALRKKDDYLSSKDYINEAFTSYGKGEDIYGALQDNPFVSILIVSYNSNSDLVDCFDSILRQTYTNWEVILVDNSDSEDAGSITRDYLEERATYIKQPNVGFAAANNVAAAASKGDLLLLLNPDASLAEDAVKELVNSIRFDGSAGIVAPKIYFKKEFLKVSFLDVPPIIGIDLGYLTKEWNYKKIFLVEGYLIGNVATASSNGRISIELPIDLNIDVLPLRFVPNEEENIKELDSICQVRVQIGRRSKLEQLEIKNLPDSKYISLSRVDLSSARKLINNAGSGLREDGTPFDRGFAEEDNGQFSQKEYIQAFCGCCALIRRNIFAYRKLFIDELFAYYEDSELSYWCDVNNIPILYNPASRVFHRHSESTSENSPSWKCMVYRSKRIYDMIKSQEDSDFYESLISDGEYSILLNQINSQLRQKLSNYDMLLKSSSRDALITRDSKRTVAVYNTYMNSYGGGEKHILSIAQELASHSDIEVTIISERDFDLSHLLDYFRLNHFAAARLLIGRMTPKLTAFYDCFINSTFLSKHISLADHSYYVVSFPGKEIPEALKDSYTFLHNSGYTAEWAANYWGVHQNVVLYPVLGRNNSSSRKGESMPEITRKDKLILSVGRYNYSGHCKNQHLIIKAFAEVLYEHPELSEWQLRVMGSVDQSVDSSRQHYEDCLQAASKCSRIEVLANVPSDLVYSSYKKAMVYVHAAGLEADLVTNPEKAEHFGIAVYDALDNGSICIVYNIGGPAHMMLDTKGAKLYSTYGQLRDALSETLTKSLDQDFAMLANASSRESAARLRHLSANRAADIYRQIQSTS